jgi:hypothetical protein
MNQIGALSNSILVVLTLNPRLNLSDLIKVIYYIMLVSITPDIYNIDCYSWGQGFRQGVYQPHVFTLHVGVHQRFLVDYLYK